MSAALNDGIETCVACRGRLGAESFAGYIVNSVGLAMFRLCPPCRDAADEAMLARIVREGEERLLLTGPSKGHA